MRLIKQKVNAFLTVLEVVNLLMPQSICSFWLTGQELEKKMIFVLIISTISANVTESPVKLKGAPVAEVLVRLS